MPLLTSPSRISYLKPNRIPSPEVGVGPFPIPTFLLAGYVSAGSSVTSGSMNWLAGDLIVAVVTESAGLASYNFTPTNTGTALTWTKVVHYQQSGSTQIQVWIAYNASAQSGTTVTFNNGGTNVNWRWSITRITGHGESTFGGATVKSSTGGQSVPPESVTLGTTAPNSLVLVAWGDWNALANAGRKPIPTSDTASFSATELDYTQQTNESVGLYAVTAPSVGNLYVGVNTTGGPWIQIAAVEIRSGSYVPAGGATQNGTISDSWTYTVIDGGSQTVNPTVAVTATWTDTINGAQTALPSVAVTETWTDTVAGSQTASATVAVTETWTDTAAGSQSVSAVVAVSETYTVTVAGIQTVLPVVAQSWVWTDAASAAVFANVAITETWTDTIAGSQSVSALVAVTETYTVTVAGVATKLPILAITETWTDTVAGSQTVFPVVAITETWTDTVAGILSQLGIVVITETWTDTVAGSQTVLPLVAITEVWTDTVAGSQSVFALVAVTETYTVTITATTTTSNTADIGMLGWGMGPWGIGGWGFGIGQDTSTSKNGNVVNAFSWSDTINAVVTKLPAVAVSSALTVTVSYGMVQAGAVTNVFAYVVMAYVDGSITWIEVPVVNGSWNLDAVLPTTYTENGVSVTTYVVTAVSNGTWVEYTIVPQTWS